MRKNTRFSRMGKLLSMISLIILGGLLPIAAAAQQNPPNAPNAGGPKNAPNAGAPAGQFLDVRVEHNVELNARKGMLIHAKFNVQNALNKPSRLVADFQYNDGRPLKGNEVAYQNAVGDAITVKDFSPTYARASYADFKLFMPYAALNMGSGKANLRFRLSMFDVNANRYFAHSGFVTFNYSK
jgi:hypothetical protein